MYTYLPRLAKSAAELSIVVFDGTTRKTIPIKPADVVVLGQTSGEWVPLGKYELPKGKAALVEIVASRPGGPVAADAVLFVPAF